MAARSSEDEVSVTQPLLLHRVTAVALVAAFILIVLGAWVRATNSGLSCPDWPTCYGHWLPTPGSIPADAGYSYGQVMLEWWHRLIAGFVLGPLVLAIAALCLAARDYGRRLPRHGLTLLLLLVLQAALGGFTVLDRNSPWSVALHLTTALFLFSVLWLIYERSSGRDDAPAARPLRSLAVVTWFLALATMASAAMTAKSGASLACATWPLCDGTLLPDMGDPLIRLHMSHRWLAAGTCLGVIGLVIGTRAQLAHSRLAAGALLAIVLQVMLGAAVVLLEIPTGLAVLHQALGVLTFALIARLMWRTRGQRPAPSRLPEARRAGQAQPRAA